MWLNGQWSMLELKEEGVPGAGAREMGRGGGELSEDEGGATGFWHPGGDGSQRGLR